MKALLLLSALLMAGCQAYQFPAPNPAWQTHVGQLQFAGRDRSVIGDVIISRAADQEFQLDFLSGPGFPILKMRVSGNRGRAESAFARGSWQGDPKRVPGPLRGWFALPEIFAAADATPRAEFSSEPAGKWNAHAVKKRGQLQQLTVDFPVTGESYRFQFRP